MNEKLNALLKDSYDVCYAPIIIQITRSNEPVICFDVNNADVFIWPWYIDYKYACTQALYFTQQTKRLVFKKNKH